VIAPSRRHCWAWWMLSGNTIVSDNGIAKLEKILSETVSICRVQVLLTHANSLLHVFNAILSCFACSCMFEIVSLS
jgi:hypothetical protein